MNEYMTVADLIEELQQVEDKSLPVVLYTDHGQCAMKAYAVDSAFVDDLDEYMGELRDEYDEDDEDDEKGTPVIVIEG